jgi:hypothetical protein
MGDLRVALEDLREESESGHIAAAVPVRRKGVPKWIWPAAAAAVAAVAAVVWAFSGGGPRRSEAFTPVPLTSFSGAEIHPSLSPDGRQVAFAWNGERRDNFDI